MALVLSDLFKIQNGAGAKVMATVAQVLSLLSGSDIKSRYEAEDNTNAFTDALKTKLENAEENFFRGTHLSKAALDTAHPSAVAGSFAYVDAGAGNDVQRYIWDDDDSKWVEQSGAVAGETAASIKTKYESNPDVNQYTNADKAKVDFISASAAVDLDDIANKSHDAVTLGANTGFVLTGQTITNDYSLLPPA